MIKLWRKLKSPSNWLMVIGIAVSFFAFTDGIELFYRVKYALSEANSFRYLHEYRVIINDPEEDILEIVNDLPGNVVDDDMLVYLDADGSYYMAELVLQQKEEFPYPVRITDTDGDVIVGEVKETFCFKKENQDYICIDGKEKRVAGVVPLGKSDVLKAKLLIFYKAGLTDEYVNSNKPLFCGSNGEDTEENIARIRKKYGNTLTISRITDIGVSTGSSEYREIQYMIIAFFAMVNSAVISEYWIIVREREIRIKRLLGFSGKKIVLSLYFEMLQNVTFSFLIVYVIRMIRIVSGEQISLLGEMPFLAVVLYMVFSLLFIGAVPAILSANFTLSKGLGE